MGKKKGVITYISFITPHPGSSFAKKFGNELEILSTDYSRYTHKQPVAVPKSLGKLGVRTMVDHYHRIGEVCDMQDVNPRIDDAYLNQIAPVHINTRRMHDDKANVVEVMSLQQ